MSDPIASAPVGEEPGTWRSSWRGARSVFWSSRLVVFAVAIWVTVADLTVNAQPEYETISHPFSNWPLHGLLELVLTPMAKWDSLHYLAISWDGYAEGHLGLPPVGTRPAFFPLYPGIVHVLSGFGSSPALVMVMAYLVSLVCFAAALTLLHRLTTIEIGERYAKPTLLLLAFFPTAFFYGIPYTESLFLLLAVGAFLAARTGHWAVAGVILALASATRVPGLILVVPVALLYLYGPRADREPIPGRTGWRPRYPIRPDICWLFLAPVGLLAFSVYLHYAIGSGLAWEKVQSTQFGRHTIDPVVGIWNGLKAGGTSFWQIVSNTYDQHPPIYQHLNVLQVVCVAFAIVAGIGALRMLPVAYGTWVLISLIPIFASQPENDPLYSATRFVAVLFPIFIWSAVVCEKRGWTTTVVAISAAGMAVLTAEFALWSFVA